MKLHEFIDKAKITRSAFADLVKADKSLVSKWVNGSVRPTEKYYTKIYEVTKGKVTPNDFFNFS